MKEFDKLIEIMEILRGKNGCEWDKKQTIHSLKEYLLEETYETLEAMENGGEELKGELGDLLLNIVFQAQISKEENKFKIEDVLNSINEKMIRRHPHIFSEEKRLSPEEVKIQWDKIKKTEKEHKHRKSILDGIPKNFPAQMKAEKIIKKVTSVGFSWDSYEGVLNKIEEELEELKVELKNKDKEKIGDELGDLMFSVINLSNYLGYNSSELLERTNKKFIKRFRHIEENCDVEKSNTETMEKYWQEAKK
ncbi:MAG: nucleoside triphosphate pyrophosphohydrolase [Fusobacteriaceae bacterium]